MNPAFPGVASLKLASVVWMLRLVLKAWVSLYEKLQNRLIWLGHVLADHWSLNDWSEYFAMMSARKHLTHREIFSVLSHSLTGFVHLLPIDLNPVF